MDAPQTQDPPDTKQRLLDAAEELFAEHGFAETSMRRLTAAAGTNLAAVNYHFGGKERLFCAVLERRLRPVNEERLRRLDAFEAQGGAPTLEQLLEAFLAPALQLLDAAEDGPRRVPRLLARVNLTEAPWAGDFRRMFDRVVARFQPALQRALPNLAPATLFWRMYFVIGAMVMTLSDPKRVCLMSDGRCVIEGTDETLRQLVAFAAGGLRAEDAAAARGREERA